MRGVFKAATAILLLKGGRAEETFHFPESLYKTKDSCWCGGR